MASQNAALKCGHFELKCAGPLMATKSRLVFGAYFHIFAVSAALIQFQQDLARWKAKMKKNSGEPLVSTKISTAIMDLLTIERATAEVQSSIQSVDCITPGVLVQVGLV